MTFRMITGKRLCHQKPASDMFGSSRTSVQNDWLACSLASNAWKGIEGCRAASSPISKMVSCRSLLPVSNGRGSAPTENWKSNGGRPVRGR